MNQASPCQVRAANRQRAHEAEVPTLVFEVATPPSTQPIISTLTTEGGGGGEEEREKMVYEKRVEKRVSGYRPSRVCLVVPTSKIKTVNDGKDG
jgi:hypothetical protein